MASVIFNTISYAWDLLTTINWGWMLVEAKLDGINLSQALIYSLDTQIS